MKIGNEQNNKKKWIIIVSIVIVLLLFGIFLFIKFGMSKKYFVTINTNGGNEVSSVEINDGEITKLPSEPKKEGYKFSAWVNDKNKVVTVGTKINTDTTFNAIWVSENAETITLSFNFDSNQKNENIVIEKGKAILLPVTPIKEGFVFAGWINEDGSIVTEGINIKENMILKALWIKEDSEIKTLIFNTDGGNSIGKIIIEKGKTIIFPVNPIKEGFVFKGWIDEKGNAIDKNTVVNNNITAKAVWIEPYTCPTNCTPSGDGSTCTKVSTKELSTGTGCPNGYSLKEGQCLDLVNAYYANHIDMAPWWSCDDSSHVQYDVCEGMGCLRMCAKKANKVTLLTCPNGYTKEGNICKKTETINCTAN